MSCQISVSRLVFSSNCNSKHHNSQKWTIYTHLGEPPKLKFFKVRASTSRSLSCKIHISVLRSKIFSFLQAIPTQSLKLFSIHRFSYCLKGGFFFLKNSLLLQDESPYLKRRKREDFDLRFHAASIRVSTIVLLTSIAHDRAASVMHHSGRQLCS